MTKILEEVVVATPKAQTFLFLQALRFITPLELQLQARRTPAMLAGLTLLLMQYPPLPHRVHSLMVGKGPALKLNLSLAAQPQAQ